MRKHNVDNRKFSISQSERLECERERPVGSAYKKCTLCNYSSFLFYTVVTLNLQRRQRRLLKRRLHRHGLQGSARRESRPRRLVRSAARTSAVAYSAATEQCALSVKRRGRARGVGCEGCWESRGAMQRYVCGARERRRLNEAWGGLGRHSGKQTDKRRCGGWRSGPRAARAGGSLRCHVRMFFILDGKGSRCGQPPTV